MFPSHLPIHLRQKKIIDSWKMIVGWAELKIDSPASATTTTNVAAASPSFHKASSLSRRSETPPGCRRAKPNLNRLNLWAASSREMTYSWRAVHTTVGDYSLHPPSPALTYHQGHSKEILTCVMAANVAPGASLSLNKRDWAWQARGWGSLVEMCLYNSVCKAGKLLQYI